LQPVGAEPFAGGAAAGSPQPSEPPPAGVTESGFVYNNDEQHGFPVPDYRSIGEGNRPRTAGYICMPAFSICDAVRYLFACCTVQLLYNDSSKKYGVTSNIRARKGCCTPHACMQRREGEACFFWLFAFDSIRFPCHASGRSTTPAPQRSLDVAQRARRQARHGLRRVRRRRAGQRLERHGDQRPAGLCR
jgi:hypothetical protein